MEVNGTGMSKKINWCRGNKKKENRIEKRYKKYRKLDAEREQKKAEQIAKEKIKLC